MRVSMFRLYSAFVPLLLLALLGGCRPLQDAGTERAQPLRDGSDLATARVATMTGTNSELFLTQTYPQAQLLLFDDINDAFLAVKSGKADYTLATLTTSLLAAKGSGLTVLPKSYIHATAAIAFNKKDTLLLRQVNELLSQYKEDGTLQELIDHWIRPDGSDYQLVERPAVQQGKPLRVGIAANSEPMCFISNGMVDGLDAELIERIAYALGRSVTYSNMPFSSLIAALEAGKVDLVISSMAATEERLKRVNFSEGYFSNPQVLTTLHPKTAAVRPLRDGSDIATARVATMTGSASAMFISTEYPQAQLLLFDDINDAFLALRSAKADYVITAFTTSLHAAKNGEFTVLPTQYVKDPCAIAFNKKDATLLRQVNALLRQFKEDGSLQEIVDRWIRLDGSEYRRVGRPAVLQGKPLRVGVAANREPMCFISEGKVEGLDAELIERIAYALGRPVEYYDMKFSALIAALESGKADLIISSLNITPERLKRVNYSEEYYVNPLVLSVLSPENAVAQVGQATWFSRVRTSFVSNLIVEKRYMMIVKGLEQTLIITFFSILLGTLIGGLICFLRMRRHALAVGFAKAYINVMRGTPILVLLMLFFYVVFASTGLSATVVAVITFALNMGAYSSEMFRTAIESVDRGQTEAGIAMGFTKIQTFIFVVLPQAVRRVIPVYKGEVISLLKMTSVVGYIAVVDLTKASDIIRSRTFDAFFPLIVVALIYFLLAWLLGLLLDGLNKKISPFQ